MKITLTTNHGNIRWRVNVQKGGCRRRIFFASREMAIAFAEATGGYFKIQPETNPIQETTEGSKSGFNLP
jgi:hypothetical protein